MRVALDGTALLEPRTGIGTFTEEVLARLADRHDVEVVVFAVTWRGRGRLPSVVPPSVRVVSRPLAARPLREAWKRADQPTIERWTGPIDVVHGPNYVVPPARAAQVVSVHDLTYVRYPELCTADTLAYPALIRRAIRRGAWVQTIPAFVDDIVNEFGAPRERVVAIRNGVGTFAQGDPAVGRAVAGGDRYLLGLGTIEPRKDFPLLVRAFDRLAAADPELRLVIAGADGWGVDAFDAAIAEAQHRDRIVRTGWVDDAQRAGLLAGASVFAYPSVYEGFGFPPLEAMACGTPVVASAVGGVPDTVGDAARLVAPGDLDALAGALDEVLHHPDLAAQLVARGTANLERFSWDRTADELVELYQQAIDERSRSGS
jgi:glycosyltransferase involved in cell wall biosynthesis